jgi:tetraacyldisaccharide 4'-kinase
MKRRKINIRVLMLFPFSLLYGLVVLTRNLFFEWGILKSTEFKLPVISVGNITAGGTGKTPHVEYLIALLKNDFHIASLSRGYKRKTRNFIIADNQSTALLIGDEPRQLKQKFPDIVVAVDRKRVHGIQMLLENPEPVDLIIMDDAFQHRYVNPGKSILLMDYNRLITDDFLLPGGFLREPAASRKRADIILITKSPERIKPIELRNIVKNLGLELHQHLFFTTIEYGDIKPVFNIQDPKNQGYFKLKKAPVILLTGIANPRPLRKFARSISTTLVEITFPDHHAYKSKDIKSIEEKMESLGNADTIILTTEKDAMRIQDLEIEDSLKKSLYYVPIQVKFLNDDQNEFNNLIFNYVRSNKRDNILHQEAKQAKS